jgi:ABC-type sugar transport system permease subunit
MSLSLSGKRAIVGLLFVLPFATGFLAFIAAGIVSTLRMSLSDVVVAGTASGMEQIWNNFQNYIIAFTQHPTFSEVLGSSILNMVIDVPLIIFFSLFMAIILNRQFIGRGFVRAIFFLPVIMGSAAIANTLEMAMGQMLGGISSVPPEVMRETTGFNAGAIIMLLDSFQTPPQVIDFLVDVIANLHEVIRAAGVQILIFLAALQSIPPSMYEVAQIEGATGYETFWKITMPMVSPLIITNVVYTVVDTYANSEVVDTAYETFFRLQNFGGSAAMSMSTAILVCLVLFAVCYLISKRVFYYD